MSSRSLDAEILAVASAIFRLPLIVDNEPNFFSPFFGATRMKPLE